MLYDLKQTTTTHDNRFPPGVNPSEMNEVVMLIGNNNIFEVGSRMSLLVDLCIQL
jgi:hypothetical protein